MSIMEFRGDKVAPGNAILCGSIERPSFGALQRVSDMGDDAGGALPRLPDQQRTRAHRPGNPTENAVPGWRPHRITVC